MTDFMRKYGMPERINEEVGRSPAASARKHPATGPAILHHGALLL